MTRRRRNYRNKAVNLTVTPQFLQGRFERAQGYPKAKWIEFCEAMLAAGYTVVLREARETVSKYISVCNVGKRYLVRFSNHSATKLDAGRDCDFFVGKNHFGTWTTEQAIKATVEALGECPIKLGSTP